MRAWLLLILFLAPATASAIEPYTCRNGLFPAQLDEIRDARISAADGARIHFRDDDKDCPGADRCIQTAYLVNDDRLLVSTSADGWTCGWHSGKTREFVGWLPAERLVVSPIPPPPSLDSWTGRWLNDPGTITIKRKGNLLAVSGSTLWQGGPNGENVHLGDFQGTARAVGDRLEITDGPQEYGCAVALRRVAGYLVVTDNAGCGGMNVRFDGIYRRAAHRARHPRQ
jgi:hypothetical protein